MREEMPCVYVLANKPRGALYVGVTSDLPDRTRQHKADEIDGFTRKYKVRTLVWFEPHESLDAAIAREKSMKTWSRIRKIRLVEADNPEWQELTPDLGDRGCAAATR